MLLSRLARKTDHMLGTDVSMGMLRAAREKLRRDQTDLVRAHSSSLPFKNGVCDAVLSISVFTLKDAKSQLSELLRVARPGGTVAITSFDSRGSVKNRILPGKNFVAEPIELSPRERLHVIRVKET